MAQLFISHVEEDQAVAMDIVATVENTGYTTWYYERDSFPGPPYLDQVFEAIENCQAVILLKDTVPIASLKFKANIAESIRADSQLFPELGVEIKEENDPEARHRAFQSRGCVQVRGTGSGSIFDRRLFVNTSTLWKSH